MYLNYIYEGINNNKGIFLKKNLNIFSDAPIYFIVVGLSIINWQVNVRNHFQTCVLVFS